MASPFLFIASSPTLWLPSFYVFSVMLPLLMVVDVWPTALSTLLTCSFFPKDNSNTPPNLRPIAVSNTDNRLIASILHTFISPAILKLMDLPNAPNPAHPLMRTSPASTSASMPQRNPTKTTTCCFMTLTVWKTRELRVWQSDLNLADATHLIATSFASIRATAFASPRKDRRPVQRQKFLALLAALPPNFLRVFTDGSSYDAIRAGAGFTVTCAKRRHQFGHSQLLGPATNNFAELTALTLAARYCATRVRDLPPNSVPPFSSLTDNRYAINAATRSGRWTAKSNLPAIAALKSALKHLHQLTSVAIHWVSAH